ncbi:MULTISPECIES: hypothetical protein [unclassified Mesorhizobium]|uniref:hypothetical protein n=1 Tax=unclassified Mesorhizobium TaxID=325217 RepID=UPI0030148C05
MMYSQNPRFHWWQGSSGYWWIATVLPLGIPALVGPAVYVMVRRDTFGQTMPLYIGQTGNLSDRMAEHLPTKLASALALGGNELHVHLLTQTSDERFAAENDLRRGHWTPLNQQPGGLFGLRGLTAFR